MSNASSSEDSFKYRPDIDGLRAICVISVILYHLKISYFSGGFLGVDIFFVISGYLITSLLLIELKNTRTISFQAFYSRRLKRLLPAILILLLFSIGIWLIYFFRLDNETDKFFESVRYGIFGFANIFFKKNIGNYFDSSTDQMPLLHLWSLGVEEQFYFIWPLLILGVYCISKNNFGRNLFVTLSLISVASFGDSLWNIYTHHQTRAFYSMQHRSWELGIGSIVAILFYFKKDLFIRLSKYNNALSFLGLALIIYSIRYFSENSYFPGWRALFPTLGAALIISFSRKGTIVFKILSTKTLVFIGLISYGLYLYHWPFIAFLNIYFNGSSISLFLKTAIVLISFLMAVMSYYFIEKPIQRSNFLKKRPYKLTIASGLAICSLFFLITKSIGRQHDKLLLSEPLKEFYSQINERPNFSEGCYGAVSNFKYESCIIASSPIKDDSKDKNIIVIWGDSITRATANLLDEYVIDKPNISIVAISNFGHPFPIVPLLNIEQLWVGENWADRANEINSNFEQQFKKMISDGYNVSIIFNAFWPGHIIFMSNDEDNTKQHVEFKRVLDLTIDKLTKVGVAKILFFNNYPMFNFNISQCVQLHGDSNCFADKLKLKEDFKITDQAIEEVTLRHSNTKLIDVFSIVCPNDKKCMVQLKDINNKKMPLVWDAIHPTSSASRYIGRKIKSDLDWLLSD